MVRSLNNNNKTTRELKEIEDDPNFRNIGKFKVNVKSTPNLQNKIIQYNQYWIPETVSADEGYDGLSQVQFENTNTTILCTNLMTNNGFGSSESDVEMSNTEYGYNVYYLNWNNWKIYSTTNTDINSRIWNMYKNENPNTGAMEYYFDPPNIFIYMEYINPIFVNQFSIKYYNHWDNDSWTVEWYLEGSNDHSNWENLLKIKFDKVNGTNGEIKTYSFYENTNKYKYYRVYGIRLDEQKYGVSIYYVSLSYCSNGQTNISNSVLEGIKEITYTSPGTYYIKPSEGFHGFSEAIVNFIGNGELLNTILKENNRKYDISNYNELNQTNYIGYNPIKTEIPELILKSNEIKFNQGDLQGGVIKKPNTNGYNFTYEIKNTSNKSVNIITKRSSDGTSQTISTSSPYNYLTTINNDLYLVETNEKLNYPPNDLNEPDWTFHHIIVDYDDFDEILLEATEPTEDILYLMNISQWISCGENQSTIIYGNQILYLNSCEQLLTITENTTPEDVTRPIDDLFDSEGNVKVEISENEINQSEIVDNIIQDKLILVACDTQNYVEYLERNGHSYSIIGKSVLRNFPYGESKPNPTVTSFVNVESFDTSYVYNSSDMIGQIVRTSQTSYKRLNPYNSTGQVIGVFSSITRD